MFFGRVFGWCLVAAAILLASADAVLAIGPGETVGIATRDLLTLLAGRAPDMADMPSKLAVLGLILMQMPAWAVVGPAGAGLVLLFRRREKRRRTPSSFA